MFLEALPVFAYDAGETISASSTLVAVCVGLTAAWPGDLALPLVRASDCQPRRYQLETLVLDLNVLNRQSEMLVLMPESITYTLNYGSCVTISIY